MNSNLTTLLTNINSCSLCKENLPNEPRPIVRAHENSKICIIGQAPGAKVHRSGIPWNDPSGDQLRKWLNVGSGLFYQPEIFAIVPMGFCYPGKGNSGDLPPRAECAPTWHNLLLEKMPNLELTLLVGQYAQAYYLPKTAKTTLTQRVRDFKDYLPRFFPLPHPSPRNRFWLNKNAWFEEDVIPDLRRRVHGILHAMTV